MKCKFLAYIRILYPFRILYLINPMNWDYHRSSWTSDDTKFQFPSVQDWLKSAGRTKKNLAKGPRRPPPTGQDPDRLDRPSILFCVPVRFFCCVYPHGWRRGEPQTSPVPDDPFPKGSDVPPCHQGCMTRTPRFPRTLRSRCVALLCSGWTGQDPRCEGLWLPH